MNENVITIQNLWKKYRIGSLHSSKNSIREQLTAHFNNYLFKIFLKKNNPARDYEINKNVFYSKARDNKEKENYFWALKDISLEIKEGEVIGLIGSNGAGKSTLLKVLSRITHPTKGTVTINNRISSLLEVGTGFHPELTGRENIYLNGVILGMKRAEIKKKIDEIISFAEITDLIDTPVKRYSSGMFVRLAFAVAAHLEPEILLVDEVLAVGDISFQKKCLGKMNAVARTGRTVIFVSHQMYAIRSLCTRTIWVDQGHIIRDGNTFDVVKEYEIRELSEYNSENIVVRKPEEAFNKNFYIGRVEFVNPANTNIFSYYDTFRLVLDFNGSPIDNYSVEFKIYKDTGEFACTGVSGILHGLYFGKNTNRVEIKVGPLVLTNGNYRVTLSIIKGEEWIDTWENACSFSIIECHPFALPREIKKPVCVIDHSFTGVEKAVY